MRPVITDGVVWSLCWTVCWCIMIMSPAKTAEPIEMPFGMWTWVSPRYHVLDRGPVPPCEGQLWGEKVRPIVMCRDCCLPWPVQKRLNRSRCHLGCGLRWHKKPLLNGGPDSHMWRASFDGKMGPAEDMPGHVRRRIYSKLFSRRQHWYGADDDLDVLDAVHICTTWQIWLNRRCVAAMRPYVELLWPLVVTHLTMSKHWRELQDTDPNEGKSLTGLIHSSSTS